MIHQLRPVHSQDTAERIASHDRNNLYLTSCLFADANRYDAFCAQYAVMRVIDDRIDAIPLADGVPDRAAAAESAGLLRAWRTAYRAIEGNRESCAAVLQPHGPDAVALASSLRASLARFPVPAILWSRFFEAMARDLRTRRFPTYRSFERYCEGASCSPTTIYLYLLASHPGPGGVYTVASSFPLMEAGRRLGRFAYLGHILRDLAEDTRLGLSYLADEDLTRHRLTHQLLRADADRGRSSAELRALVREIAARAKSELRLATALLVPHWRTLAPDCARILRLIVRIYERVLERIELREGEVMDGAHLLTALERQELVAAALRETA
jgi:phytoene/squalene synthetase